MKFQSKSQQGFDDTWQSSLKINLEEQLIRNNQWNFKEKYRKGRSVPYVDLVKSHRN